MFYYIMAFLIGLCLAIQAPINASLGRSINQAPIVAALINFIIGTVVLALVAYFYGVLNTQNIKASFVQDWWKYLGGVLGAFVVFASTFLAPKLGLVNMFLFVILGQIITGLLLDKFGAFNLAIKEISLFKILGLFIILAGLLVFFYKELFKGN